MMFHENQQVQLLSDADDFGTVDSGPGGNTDWVQDCIRFHIQLRYRMDGTMDLRRVSCTLVAKPHVRRLPMDMYNGTIQSYARHPAPHTFIIIPRLDRMCVELLPRLNLGAATDHVVNQTDVERDVNQTQSSGSGQEHRSTSTQMFRAVPYSHFANDPDILALAAPAARSVQANQGEGHMHFYWC